LVLREIEDVVPEARLEMALQLGEIEVGPTPFGQQPLRVVEEIEAEIEEAAGHRRAAHLDMPLVEVPPAGTDHEGGHPVVQPVFLALGALERDTAFDGV